MATSSIRFILGLLFTIGSLSATAQSPQAPDAPDRPVQPPGMIGPPVPLSQQRDVPNFPNVEQIMVLLAPVSKSTAQPISQWQKRLSDAVGVPLKHSGLHYIDDDGSQMHVFKLPKLMTKTNAEDLVMRIRLLPGVKHADIDGGSFGSGFAIPSDPLYLSSQWNLQSGGAQSPQAPATTPPPVPLSLPPPDLTHLPNITEIMVTLKPHVRAYVNRKYNWGNGKTEYRCEEAPMRAEQLRKLSAVAGTEFNLKKRTLPEGVRLLREEAPFSEQEAQKRCKAPGGELINEIHILIFPYAMTIKEVRMVADRVETHPDVEYADPVTGGYGFAIPTDPLYATKQWNLKGGVGGANLPPAWDLTTGKNTLVVAVIDSGILKNHPEFTGRLLSGYDFVTDATRANDGGGRDTDPADPGNWVTQAEVNGGGVFTGCKVHNSNWHGTGVAGVIGAAANNAQGIAGVDWNVKLLPVRVMGKCVGGGEYVEPDLIAAINWAAGISVSGVPANPNPAKVINLSLGAPTACSAALQSAVNAARRKGAVVVAAVGNTEGGSALQNSPANCNGVVRVAATTRQGGLAWYSNRGEAASISAPGGDHRTNDPLDAISSPADGGATTPLNDGSIGNYAGTSSAAPHVAGVASLMLALRPKTAPQLINHMLVNTARNFPIGTSFDCDNITCGSGILDAEHAAWAAKSRHAGGIYHTAAVRSDGAVLTWGYNGNGQLGGGEAFGALRTSPGAPIAVLPNAADVASGYYHNVAAKTDGTVWTWGYNGQFQLGDGSGTDRASPVQVAGLTNVVAVAAGDRHTLALKEDGTVWAWGYNFFGQLGAGPFDFTDRSTPVQVAGLTDVLAIAGGGKRSIALKKDGSVWAWGERSDVSPDGTNASISAVPIQVSGLADIVAIAAGGESTTGVNEDVSMALTYDGKVFNWGSNDFGQLGIGNTSTKFSPQLVSTLPPTAVQVSTGGNHTGALLEDGTLWMWGYNGEGGLGDGTTTHRLSPVQVSAGLFKTVDIVAGPHHSLALAGDTALRAWGSNAGGQLGDGTQSNRLAPVQVHGQGNSGFYYAGYTSSASADLGVSMADSPDPIAVGGTLTYSISVLNSGASAATNARAIVALPAQATFVSATAGCTFANATVTCALGTLASGGSASVQVTVQPTGAGALSASVSVNSDLFDPNSGNDVAAVSTTVTETVADGGDIPTLPEWGAMIMGSMLLMSMYASQRRRAR